MKVVLLRKGNASGNLENKGMKKRGAQFDSALCSGCRHSAVWTETDRPDRDQ